MVLAQVCLIVLMLTVLPDKTEDPVISGISSEPSAFYTGRYSHPSHPSIGHLDCAMPVFPMNYVLLVSVIM